MNTQEILCKLNEIFQDVFDDEDLQVSMETTAQDIEEWDSLMHISLIVSVENTFQIKFSMEEVAEMKNVGEMVKMILEKIQ